MRIGAIVAAVSMLASCSPPPREASLAGLDLNDPGTLRTLSRDLSGPDRAALATYALLHWPGSKSFCGRPAFARVRPPATVGEAIGMTLAFDGELAAKRRAERRPGDRFAERADRERRLVDEFDQLTLERDMVEAGAMNEPTRSRRLRELDARLAANSEMRRATPDGSLF